MHNIQVIYRYVGYTSIIKQMRQTRKKGRTKDTQQITRTEGCNLKRQIDGYRIDSNENM